MSQLVSVCGLLCEKCDYFGHQCRGCHAVQGRTFWAKGAFPNKVCPLYKCAIIDKKYSGCGRCPGLPCNKFADLKDPSISGELHAKSINERVTRLM